LFVYETLDLGLSASLSSCSTLDEEGIITESVLSSNVPTLVLDPLYPDTIYIYHSLGAHAISIGKWSSRLCKVTSTSPVPSPQKQEFNSNASSDEEDFNLTEFNKFLHSEILSEVVWVVKTFSPSSIAQSLSNPDSNLSNLIPTSVAGLVVLSDVYLGYTLLAFTEDCQLVAIELGLRVKDSDVDEFDLDRDGVSGSTQKIGDLLPKGYISLLGTEAFIPPEPFSTPNGLPSAPRLTNSNVPGGKSELQVNPTTLRFLAERANLFRTEIRTVVKSGNSVQSRLNLQIKEMERQLEKLKDIRNRSGHVIGKSKNGNGESLADRLKRVEQAQLALIKRTDKTLQGLMDKNQPVISQSERKWFKELDRIADEVGVLEERGDERRGLKLMEEKVSWRVVLGTHFTRF